MNTNALPFSALSAPAALLALLLCTPMPAAAQNSAAEVGARLDTVQGAVENPDCVTEAVTNQVVAEGARRVGAATGQLLGKIGIRGAAPATRAPAANPCQAQAQAQGRNTAATPAVTPPVATPTIPRPSTTRTVNRQGGRNCGALGTGCADGMRPLVACMEEKDGYLWKVLADAVEAKRDATPGLSSQQLVDINADIAALRAAHAAGAARVEPVDPARPSRYNDWLTPQEYSAAAGHANQSINEHREACHAKHSRF